MGKKSRRTKQKTQQKGGGGGQSAAIADGDRSADALAPQQPPAGASCWICLDGDPDEGGKPLVRDCSCRGNDAGFAHLSCLVDFAEAKTKELAKADEGYIFEPWATCPNCHQDYNGRVVLDMSKGMIAFVDENYPGIDIMKLSALSKIVQTISGLKGKASPELLEEGQCAAKKMISVIQENTRVHDGDGSIANELTTAYGALARWAEEEGSKDGDDMALYYWGLCLDFYKSRGNTVDAIAIEALIERLKSKRKGGKGKPLHQEFNEEKLKIVREHYESWVRENGVNNYSAVTRGIIFMGGLHHLKVHGLECERFATKLHPISLRVLGPTHENTTKIEETLALTRVRKMVDTSRFEEYHVLRAGNTERKYIVEKGSAPNKGEVKEVAIDSRFFLVPGTPVVCHGLKKAAHLNGKLGDVRVYDIRTGRYPVRFENRRLGSALVKPENLRIVFELPGVEA